LEHYQTAHNHHCFIFAIMSSNPNPEQTPITKFTCPQKSYSSATKVEDTPSTSPATTVASSVTDTLASAHTTDSSVFLSTPASANKCTPPGEALIRAQQIRVMTLISKLKDLKDIMTKKNNNNKCSNKKENTTSVPHTSSSLNQRLFIHEQSNI
jgi:hypothetical protein